MSLRTWINQHPAVAVLVVIVLLGGALGIALLLRREPVQRVWYYDVGNKTLFPAATEPTVGPSGQEALRAHVFACDCSDPGQHRFYVEKFTPQSREAMGAGLQESSEGGVIRLGGAEAAAQAVLEGQLVADPQELSWMSVVSAQGAELVRSTMQFECPGGTTPQRCQP